MTRNLEKKFEFKKRTMNVLMSIGVAGLIATGAGSKINNKYLEGAGVLVTVASVSAFCGYSQRNSELRREEYKK